MLQLFIAAPVKVPYKPELCSSSPNEPERKTTGQPATGLLEAGSVTPPQIERKLLFQ